MRVTQFTWGRSGVLNPSISPSEKTVSISSVIGFSSLMSYFARDLKFFEREGLDAKIIYAQTNVGLAALTAGNFDYSNFTTSAVEATLRGMPLRLIAVTNAEPLWGIVVRKDITKISELKGKKLGVSSFGGTSLT